MNTWFKKNSVWYQTWILPATGMTHMINQVMMQIDQQIYCKDNRVMRGPTTGQIIG